MKEVIGFLRQLAAHNNREWFAAHKADYVAAQTRFNGFAERLIDRMALIDPSLSGLSVKDCTYRIYRDTRFSHDKSPYKTHMGCFLCRSGKKSGYSGYYFHLGLEPGSAYPDGHMLAAGHYCIEPKALQVLREDISMGEGDFQACLDQAGPRFRLDPDNLLKRPPRGYDDQTPYIDLIKYKVHCLIDSPTREEIEEASQEELLDWLCQRFGAAKPFIDYLNRAIEYARENE